MMLQNNSCKTKENLLKVMVNFIKNICQNNANAFQMCAELSLLTEASEIVTYCNGMQAYNLYVYVQNVIIIYS
jgi:hypothetical protein